MMSKLEKSKVPINLTQSSDILVLCLPLLVFFISFCPSPTDPYLIRVYDSIGRVWISLRLWLTSPTFLPDALGFHPFYITWLCWTFEFWTYIKGSSSSGRGQPCQKKFLRSILSFFSYSLLIFLSLISESTHNWMNALIYFQNLLVPLMLHQGVGEFFITFKI